MRGNWALVPSIILFFVHVANGQTVMFTSANGTVLKDTGIYIDLKFTNSQPQLLNGTLITNVTFGDNLLFKVALSKVMFNGKLLFLGRITGNEGPCKFANRYLGRWIHDIEKLAGLVPGHCPIPRGTYNFVNYPSKLENLPLPSLPNGRLNVQMDCVEKATKKLLSTFIVELELSRG